MSEAKAQAEIMLYLGTLSHVRVWRQNTGKAELRGRVVQFGVPGQADISGIVAPHGRRLEIECKSATGRLRTQQRKFGEMIERMGGLFVVARSVEDVKDAFRARGISTS